MKRARRLNLYNRAAIVDAFARQGLARSMAEPLTSDMKLIIPLLIRELGAERTGEILRRRTAELSLGEKGFFPQFTPHIVRWAEDEIKADKQRKRG